MLRLHLQSSAGKELRSKASNFSGKVLHGNACLNISHLCASCMFMLTRQSTLQACFRLVQASRTAEEDAEKAAAAARAVYGEPFADKAKRVQGLSPHGRRPGWAVRPIIVKSGDDCRQVRLVLLSLLLVHCWLPTPGSTHNDLCGLPLLLLQLKD